MFNSNCASVPLVASIDGNGNNGNGAWGDGGWWVLIILFALIFGWGGNGWGNNGGGMGSTAAAYTDSAIQRGFDTSNIVSKLDGITNGLSDGFYAMNTGLMNGFNGVDRAVCDLGYQTQQGFNNTNMAMMQNTNAIQSTLNNMAAQNAACCCETQRQIERGFADTNYNMATQACETRQAIADSTRNILDFLTQDKIATLTAENQSLKFAASQTAQNQFITQVGSDIVNRLQPVPVPAFPASNLYAYGNGSGCGCNSCC